MKKISKIIKLIFFNVKKILSITTHRYVLVLTDENGETYNILEEVSFREIPNKIKYDGFLFNVIGSLHDITDINNIIIYIYLVKINKNDLQ